MTTKIMDQDLAGYFFEEASKSLSFVLANSSFSSPTLRVDKGIGFVTVTFKGKNLAIECILDEPENDIDCKIVCVVNGEIAPDFAIDVSGARVREGLWSFLRRRGVRGRLFTPVGKYDFRRRIRITLADFARMLKVHGQEILDDSPSAMK